MAPSARDILLTVPVVSPSRCLSDDVTLVDQAFEDRLVAEKQAAQETGTKYANNELVGVTAHRRGKIAATPCSRCQLSPPGQPAKKRKFKDCVVFDGLLAGKCTNCYVARSSSYPCSVSGDTSTQAEARSKSSGSGESRIDLNHRSRVETWVQQIHQKFDELLEAARIRFAEAHPDFPEPGYWQWIFKVSKPQSQNDWPSIYIPVKQRTPKIDGWDASKILALLRLTETGRLWVRGLTDMQESLLNPDEPYVNEVAKPQTLMKNRLTEIIESAIGRPIQYREPNPIDRFDPSSSDLKAPNLYEWKFSNLYPSFPQVRGGVSRWTIEEIKECEAALDRECLLIVPVVDPTDTSDSDADVKVEDDSSMLISSRDHHQAHEPISINNASTQLPPSPSITTNISSRTLGVGRHTPVSRMPSYSNGPEQDLTLRSTGIVHPLANDVSELTDKASNSGNIFESLREVQSMMFKSFLERAMDERAKLLTDTLENTHRLQVLELQTQLDKMKEKSRDWERKYTDRSVRVNGLHEQVVKLESEAEENAKALPMLLSKAREEGEAISRSRTIEDMEASMDGERRAIRITHLDQLEKVRVQAYQKGLVEGRTTTSAGGPIALSPNVEDMAQQKANDIKEAYERGVADEKARVTIVSEKLAADVKDVERQKERDIQDAYQRGVDYERARGAVVAEKAANAAADETKKWQARQKEEELEEAYQRGLKDASADSERKPLMKFEDVGEVERLREVHRKEIEETEDRVWREGKQDALDQIIQVGGDLQNPSRIRAIQELFRHWGNLPQRVFPAEMVPSAGFSNTCLGLFARLSTLVTAKNARILLDNEIDFREKNAGTFPEHLVIDTPLLKAVLAQFDVQPVVGRPLDERITQAPPAGPRADRRLNGSVVTDAKTPRGPKKIDRSKRVRSPSPTRTFSGQAQRPSLNTDFHPPPKRSRLSNTPTESPHRSATYSSEYYDRYDPQRDRGGGGRYWDSDRDRWPPRGN